LPALAKRHFTRPIDHTCAAVGAGNHRRAPAKTPQEHRVFTVKTPQNHRSSPVKTPQNTVKSSVKHGEITGETR
jgi:hypothetical protein